MEGEYGGYVVAGIDLANGPDCSVMSDGTVKVNPYYEETQG